MKSLCLFFNYTVLLATTSAGALLGALPAHAADPATEIEAVAAELERGVQGLRLDAHERPYLASFRWIRGISWVIDGSYGGAALDRLRSHAYGQVDLRVGSRARDDGSFLGEMSQPVVALSLTPDPGSTRHRLWRAMDDAYRASLANFIGKKALLERLQDPQLPPDRVGAPAAVSQLAWAPDAKQPVDAPNIEGPFPREQWHEFVSGLSNRFAEHPEIDNGDVLFEYVRASETYVSTEGVVLGRMHDRGVLAVVADTQAADGMRLDHGAALHFVGLPELDATLRAKAQSMVDTTIAELRQLAGATRLDEEYDGPILFHASAAAGLLATTAATQAGGEPSPLSHYGRITELEPDWLGALGRNVMPAWIDLIDDPGDGEFSGFAYDARGYPARRLELVSRGVLTHLLMTEVPNAERSGSHGRARSSLNFTQGPSISHLQLKMRRRGQTMSRLERSLLRRALEDGYDYAYIVESLRDAPVVGGLPRDSARAGSSDTKVSLPPPSRIWRLSADGQRTMVRGALFAPVSMRVLRRVRETGREIQRTRLRIPPGMSGGMASEIGVPGLIGQTIDVEVSTPALLIDGFELLRERGEQERLPQLVHPLRATGADAYLGSGS